MLSPYRVTAEPISSEVKLEDGENDFNDSAIRSNEELSLQLLSNSQAPGADQRHTAAGEETMGSQYQGEGTSTQYLLGDGMNYRSVRGRSDSPMHLATGPAEWLSPELGPPSRSWTFPNESHFP